MARVKAIVPATVFLSLVAIIGVAVALQGWNSRNVNFDLLPYIEDARALITLGKIPEKGTLTSFASYTPPGITWLMIPGAYWLADPRLFESIGCALLYLGTLIGVFLLAREYLGTACAYLAAVLWGLSELGLFFAESTNARGHPFFFVWMVYWTTKWVERQSSRYLALALATWGLGMYVFLEIAPAFFIVPVIWLLYRPRLRLSPLLLAGALIAVVWYPYLRFEISRSLIDLKSQVLRERIQPTNFKEFWCNPSLAPESWRTTVEPTSDGRRSVASHRTIRDTIIEYVNAFFARVYLILTLLLIANFNHSAEIPGANVVLLFVSLAGALMLSLQKANRRTERFLGSEISSITLKWLGITAVLAAIVLNEFILARLSPDGSLAAETILNIRRFQALLLISGSVLVTLRNKILTGLRWLISTAQLNIPHAQGSASGAIIAVSLVVPWLILLSMTEAERLQRFWWLWPLQIVALASVVTILPKQLKLSRFWIATGSLGLFLLLVGNPLVLSRIDAWVKNGWSGPDTEKIRAVDYIASRLKSEGKHRVAVGYNLYTYRFRAVFHAVDARYKIGGDLDLMFRYRHGIVNTNPCAEGVSAEDEYRVVQTSSRATDEAARQFIPIPRDNRFFPLRKFAEYQVLQRH